MNLTLPETRRAFWTFPSWIRRTLSRTPSRTVTGWTWISWGRTRRRHSRVCSRNCPSRPFISIHWRELSRVARWFSTLNPKLSSKISQTLHTAPKSQSQTKFAYFIKFQKFGIIPEILSAFGPQNIPNSWIWDWIIPIWQPWNVFRCEGSKWSAQHFPATQLCLSASLRWESRVARWRNSRPIFENLAEYRFHGRKKFCGAARPNSGFLA